MAGTTTGAVRIGNVRRERRKSNAGGFPVEGIYIGKIRAFIASRK